MPVIFSLGVFVDLPIYQNLPSGFEAEALTNAMKNTKKELNHFILFTSILRQGFLIFLIITNYMHTGKYQLSKSRWNLDYLLILCPTSGQSAMGIKKIQYVAILNWQL